MDKHQASSSTAADKSAGTVERQAGNVSLPGAARGTEQPEKWGLSPLLTGVIIFLIVITLAMFILPRIF